jgi:hypothetical protein
MSDDKLVAVNLSVLKEKLNGWKKYFILAAAVLVFGLVAGFFIGKHFYAVSAGDPDTTELRSTIDRLSVRNAELESDLSGLRSVNDELERLNQRSLDGVRELRQINSELSAIGVSLQSSNSRLAIFP